MVGVHLREAFQCCGVPCVFLFTHSEVLPEADALQVAVQQRGFVRSVGMKAHQSRVEADGLCVISRDLRCGIRHIPFQELLRRPEDRPVCRDLDVILRLRPRLLARCVEPERIVRQEVVERRAVRIRHCALHQQRIELGDLDGL